MSLLIRSLVVVTLAWLGGCAAALQIDPASLQANGLTTPLGLSSTTPRLSWIATSDTRNDNQTAYQLQASSDSTFATVDFWDTGKTPSDDFSVIYAGEALGSRDRAYWRVRSWDASDAVGAWSEASWFELAFMNQSDWAAQWITNEQYVQGINGLPMFAKSFNASCSPEKARLYLLGLGVQWATLNGVPVSDEMLGPSYSTMNKTLFYNSYDVTGLITSGANVLGVELGKGEYDATKGLDGRYTKLVADNAPRPLKLIAQLEYSCGNGSLQIVVSDASWQTTVDGPTLEANWYGGWEYDARRETKTAFLPHGNRTGWQKANLTTSPYPDLHPQLLSPEMPPLRIVETFPCVAVTKTNVSSYVFDFGQNFAGIFNFTLGGNRGDRIFFWPAERLLANGSADQSTTATPISDGYTFASNGTESYTNRLMYHGFRYLEVYGLQYEPSPADITGLRIRFVAAKTGSFDTNVALFNDIHRIIDQAIQNNMYSVLTDCPHREKLSWLDDDHLAIDPVFFGYDLRGFGRHLMKQIIDAQNSAGEVPTTAPQLTVFGSWPPYGNAFDVEPNWGVAIMLFALKHYRTYGDIEILSDFYPAMQSYVEYLEAQNASYILSVSLGDWEAPDSTTPFALTGTGGFAYGVAGMIEIASILGEVADVSRYQTLHKNILAAYQQAFFNTTYGITYGSGSQCSDAMSLDIGAVPQNYTSAVYDHLITKIRNNGTHLSVGEMCLPPFFNTLSSAGYHGVLYDVMSQTTSPSYGYQVVEGATSLTELWDGPTGSGSLDHFMLGYADTWLYGLAGMKQSQSSAGWRCIDFKPIIVGDVTSANASFHSVRGLVAASWELQDSTLAYSVMVPVGSNGTVYLPSVIKDARLDDIPHAVANHTDVRSSWQDGNTTIVEIGSGTYNFSSKLV